MQLLSIDECGSKYKCHTQKYKTFKSMDSYQTFMCNFYIFKTILQQSTKFGFTAHRNKLSQPIDNIIL